MLGIRREPFHNSFTKTLSQTIELQTLSTLCFSTEDRMQMKKMTEIATNSSGICSLRINLRMIEDLIK